MQYSHLENENQFSGAGCECTDAQNHNHNQVETLSIRNKPHYDDKCIGLGKGKFDSFVQAKALLFLQLNLNVCIFKGLKKDWIQIKSQRKAQTHTHTHQARKIYMPFEFEHIQNGKCWPYIVSEESHFIICLILFSSFAVLVCPAIHFAGLFFLFDSLCLFFLFDSLVHVAY